MVCHDGPKGKPNQTFSNIFDNLIAQERIPPMVVIQIANGGGDAQGHQRGKEYDTMSGALKLITLSDISVNDSSTLETITGLKTLSS